MSETTPNPPTDPRDGFTPGPWRVDDRLPVPVGDDSCLDVRNDSGWAVATAWGNSFGETTANARLIASAPTLLADNERLRKRVADLEEMLDEADDELWLTYPNGETNTPAANLRERIRAALALAGHKGNEHGT